MLAGKEWVVPTIRKEEEPDPAQLRIIRARGQTGCGNRDLLHLPLEMNHLLKG